MSAVIKLVEGADDDTTITLVGETFAYNITESGVLQVIRELENGEIIVEQEYSPAAWLKVSGTRYLTTTDPLDGRDGVFGDGPGDLTIV